MANLGKMLEGPAYGILNEIMAEFRSADGFARPTRFEVMIYPPTGKAGKPAGDLSNIFASVMGESMKDGTTKKTGLMCQSIAFPGRNLDTAPDENIYGPTREIVQGYSYAEVTGVFRCSSDMKEKKFFETWQRLAYNPQTWSLGYYKDYSGALDIYQLDERDIRRYGVQLVECFPKNISEMSLDHSTVDTIHTISVTFSYRYWKNLTDEADLPKPLVDRIADTVVNTIERKIQANIPKVLSRLL